MLFILSSGALCAVRRIETAYMRMRVRVLIKCVAEGCPNPAIVHVEVEPGLKSSYCAMHATLSGLIKQGDPQALIALTEFREFAENRVELFLGEESWGLCTLSPLSVEERFQRDGIVLLRNERDARSIVFAAGRLEAASYERLWYINGEPCPVYVASASLMRKLIGARLRPDERW